MTQAAAIVSYLRKHRVATTWELMQVARSTSVHKRVSEAERGGYLEPTESILRSRVARSGRWVTLYSLVRA